MEGGRGGAAERVTISDFFFKFRFILKYIRMLFVIESFFIRDSLVFVYS